MDVRRGLFAALVGAVLLLESASLLRGDTFTVTTTADSGAGSYRQAILDANANPGPDTIAFNIPGPGPYVITPTAPWGAFTEPIVIDGTTQPGYAGTPLIELADFSGGAISLQGGDSTVRGLCIRGFNTAIQLGSSGNHVEGCFIGTDVTGTVAAPNGTGFDINSGDDNNTVGGATAAARNVISGNATGIFFIGNSGNVVFGNYIGVSASGGAAIPNGTGISGTGTTNLTIGGPGAGERNVIAGNVGDGILLSSGSGAKIQGNFIGVDVTGSVALPNDYGIDLAGHDGALIGGDFNAGEGNLISSNAHYGVYIGSNGNTVTGNTIGVDAAGQQPMSNGYGVFIAGTANDNVIGGVTNGLGNAIAWNDTGVLNAGIQNAIRGNAIFFNAKLGIDNYPFGVDNNDPLDTDGGSNQLQNFPFIASIDYGTTNLTVHGILKSSPNTTFDLDFYESPTCTPRPRDLLQSAYFLGTQQVTTDGSGDAPFDILLNDNNAAGQPPISVTATDPLGNTSEFSQNVIYASSPRSGPPSVSRACPYVPTTTG
jgi:parallel beta-helix repeat protein